MLKPQLWLCVVVFVCRSQFPICNAQVGSARQYVLPYTPTACFGNALDYFPTNNLFAAAGEGIWDNGAACGRQYTVQCISSTWPLACVPNQTIQVDIVDRALNPSSRPNTGDVILLLSTTAFAAIADPRAPIVNIQYEQIR